MLFNSLIRRLNGGSDVNSPILPNTGGLLSVGAYERFPNLPVLIMRLLRVDDLDGPRNTQTALQQISASLGTTAQRVFPALEILARSGLPGVHRVSIVDLIHHHMQSPGWSIREKAANTLALVVREQDIALEIDGFLRPDWQSQNDLHGRLLCVRRLVSRLGATGDSASSLRLLVMFRSDEDEGKFSLAKFIMHKQVFLVNNRCAITAAAYLNVLNDILESLVQRKSKSKVEIE